MEYQKIANLIDDPSNQHSKFFKKRIGLKLMMNHTMLIVKSSLKLQC